MGFQLYRHFDANGRLLYVGMSLSVINRTISHKRSGWFDDIFFIEIEHFQTKKEVLFAEMTAIRTESPFHNIAMAPKSLSTSEKISLEIKKAIELGDLKGMSKGMQTIFKNKFLQLTDDDVKKIQNDGRKVFEIANEFGISKIGVIRLKRSGNHHV